MKTADRDPRPRFFWLALACSLLFSSVYFFVFWCIAKQHGVPSDPGWEAKPVAGHWYVTQVEPNGPADGKIKPGDRLLAIDGSRRVAAFGPRRALEGKRPGAQYGVTVERDGVDLGVTLAIRGRPDMAWQDFSLLIYSLLDFAMAVWIGFARPEFKTAQLGFAGFLAGAQTFIAPVIAGFQGSLSGVALLPGALIGSQIWRPLEVAVGYDFLSRFPAPVPETRNWRALRLIIYVAAIALWIPAALVSLASLMNLARRSALLPSWFPLTQFDAQALFFRDIFGVFVCIAAPAALIRNYLLLRDIDARRRLRWAGLGLLCGVAPFAFETALVMITRAMGGEQASLPVQHAIDPAASALSALAPILLAYAVVKHRVFGIRVVIRRGVQYLFAKNVLRLVLYTPLIAIAVEMAAHPNRPIQDLLLHGSWLFYLFVALTAAISLRYHSQLKLWIDRKFFRVAYEQETILAALIDRIQASESMEEVSRVVARELELAFHPSDVSILYRKESAGFFTIGHPQGSADALQVRGVLNERIREALQAQTPARTFAEFSTALYGGNSGFIQELRHKLILPITSSDETLLSVVILGTKKSEESYSNRDHKFLQAVAGQIAFAYEVLSLKERMREEQRVRVEVLGRLDQRNIQLINECPSCGVCYDSPVTHCERDGSALSLTLPVERIIDGKYRLDRRIGTGGMGAVFESSDLRLNRIVAIKILTGRLFGNQAALRRFEREARTAAKLNHPNIVGIYDFGSLRGGGAYLVMEFVRGRSWREELKEAERIDPTHTADWFNQLCEAMALAHGSGVIHRDLKPENVMLSDTASGQKITVLDFGLAKILSETRSGEMDLTTESVIAGTYGYMSPEQRSGGIVDERTDIYALGVMVVETLTRLKPPPSGASPEWMRSTLRWPRPTSATEQLRDLLEECLREDSSQRVDRIRKIQPDLVSLLRQCPPLLLAKAASAGGDTITRGR